MFAGCVIWREREASDSLSVRSSYASYLNCSGASLGHARHLGKQVLTCQGLAYGTGFHRTGNPDFTRPTALGA
jgi:hypothetical protein